MTATPEVMSKPPPSDARLEANRANAQKSTGPTSDDGKRRSRMNALKHGLSGAGVAMPETMRLAVQERTAGWASSFKPLNPWELWLLEITAITTLRLEVCEQSRLMSVVLKAQRADHAEIWEVDRENEVAETLAKFAHDPVQQVAKLRQTMQGVRWLLARWEDLRRCWIRAALGKWRRAAWRSGCKAGRSSCWRVTRCCRSARGISKSIEAWSIARSPN